MLCFWLQKPQVIDPFLLRVFYDKIHLFDRNINATKECVFCHIFELFFLLRQQLLPLFFGQGVFGYIFELIWIFLKIVLTLQEFCVSFKVDWLCWILRDHLQNLFEKGFNLGYLERLDIFHVFLIIFSPEVPESRV